MNLSDRNMRRRTVILLALAAGGIGVLTAPARGAFIAAFCGAFWFGAVLAVGLWAAGSGTVEDTLLLDQEPPPDPWVDEFGVQRFPGDVYDFGRHRIPGDEKGSA